MMSNQSKLGITADEANEKLTRRAVLAAGGTLVGAAFFGSQACSTAKPTSPANPVPVGPIVGSTSFDGAPLAQQAVFDHFDGPSGTIPNPVLWEFDLINQGGSQTYLPNNVHLDGESHVVFEATGNAHSGYFSGGITSRTKFNMQYGTIAARIKVPRGPGFLPAFWLLGTGYPAAAGQPDCGEIDIFEIYGMPFSQQFSVADHYWNANGQGSWGTPISPPGGFDYSADGPDLSAEFHTWWLQWTADSITGGMDDYTFGTFTPADALAVTGDASGTSGAKPGWSGKPPTSTSMQWVFRSPFYVIMNFALGVPWLSPIDDNLIPAKMMVDWFSYQPPVDGVPPPVPKF